VAGSLRDTYAEARNHLLRVRRTVDGRQEYLIPVPKLRGTNRPFGEMSKSGCDLYLPWL